MKQITLNIGGEDRVFYFGLGFLGNLLESENIAMNEIDAKLAENPFKWIPLIMFYSCAFGYKRKNEFAPFDAFEVADWIDEVGMNSEVVTDFFKAFTQSLTKDVPVSKDDKKKVTKK
jgi:hypothetical protein